MNKYLKIVVFAAGAAVLLFLGKVIFEIPYRKEIPSITDLQSLSKPILKQLREATFHAKINPSANNLGNLGMAYHSILNYENAAICYKLAVRKNKSKWIWSYYLGYLNEEMGNSANAITNFQTVIKENPNAFHAWFYLGEAYQNIGENDKAIVAFEKIQPWTVKQSDSKTATRNDFFSLYTYVKCQIASLYINTKQIDLAEKSLNEIIDGNKSFGWAFRLLGQVYSLKGDSIYSNKNIIRASDLINYTTPVDTIIDQLAKISRSELYLLKQIDEADKNRYFDWELQLINQGFKYLPDNKYLISKAVTFYLKNNTAKQALPFLKKHFQLFNNDFNELKYVANLLFEKRYFAQSNLYFTRVLELKPDETDLQVFIVLGLFNQNEKQKAINLMNDYLKEDSLNVKVLTNTVVELLDMEELEKTGYYLEKLQKLSPADAKTLLLSGKVAFQKGEIQKAQSFYETSFIKNPNDIVTVKALSDVLMRQKLWGKAQLHFKKSMVYFPNEPYLLEIYGTLLIVCPEQELRNYTEGIEYLERAFYHKDCPPEIAISAGKSLAEAYVVLGNKQVATAYLKLVIDFAKSLNLPHEFTDKLEERLNEIGS